MADGVQAVFAQNPPCKRHKYSLASQICLRSLAAVASLVAASIVFTNKQTITLFGIELDARYSYSSAFKFLAVAKVVACVLSVVSLVVAVTLDREKSDPRNYFYMFLHDLVVMTLVMAACAAATAIAFVAKYGNDHVGWIAICDNFARFCDRMIISLVLSYITLVLYLLLTVISANKSRKILA